MAKAALALAPAAPSSSSKQTVQIAAPRLRVAEFKLIGTRVLAKEIVIRTDQV
jgi:hypothetical protein